MEEIGALEAQLSESEKGTWLAKQASSREGARGEAMQVQISQLTEAVACLC
jgi:hypothetical protein